MNVEVRYINYSKDVHDLKSWLKWKRRRRSFEPEITAEEQEAFDLGYKQAMEFGQSAENPYEDHADTALWEAWETGHSAGMLGREENSVDSEKNSENISR